jgi:hypothetical protein
LENANYDEFLSYASDQPIGSIITSIEKFELLQEAHALRREGELAEAQAILNDLGFTSLHRPGKWYRAQTELTDDEQEALRVAKSANDRDTVRAILRGAGLE